METGSSPTNANGMDLLEKSMYDISGNDLLDIWDADIASVGINNMYIHDVIIYNMTISTQNTIISLNV